MENRKIKVAITHGDTNGVGYELIFKTFAEAEILDLCTPIVYGSPKVAAYYRKAMNLPAQFSIIQQAEEAEDGRLNLLAVVDEDVKVDMGIPSLESGKAAIKALDRAMTDFRNGLYDVLLTAPINSANAKIEGYSFSGHKEYLETCLGDGKHALDIWVGENLRVASVTGKTPIKEVSAAISKEVIVEAAVTFLQTIKRDFRISSPRIAVLSLNPKTPENNEFGMEEEQVIKPAVNELADKGIQAFGPYASDEFFGKGYYLDFDGVLSMYYDQAATPFRALSANPGIVYTAGLPLVRTSVDITPCYEIAGVGKVEEMPFRHALFLGMDAFRNRQMYDEPFANPLPKLYHEKRDESEKVRFAIPKKHSNGQSAQKTEKKGQDATE